MFVKALLSYCYFSNEFVQDESTIKICEVKNRIQIVCKNYHAIFTNIFIVDFSIRLNWRRKSTVSIPLPWRTHLNICRRP